MERRVGSENAADPLCSHTAHMTDRCSVDSSTQGSSRAALRGKGWEKKSANDIANESLNLAGDKNVMCSRGLPMHLLKMMISRIQSVPIHWSFKVGRNIPVFPKMKNLSFNSLHASSSPEKREPTVIPM